MSIYEIKAYDKLYKKGEIEMTDCSNNRPCPCTYDCPRHGKCCACVHVVDSASRAKTDYYEEEPAEKELPAAQRGGIFLFRKDFYESGGYRRREPGKYYEALACEFERKRKVLAEIYQNNSAESQNTAEKFNYIELFRSEQKASGQNRKEHAEAV